MEVDTEGWVTCSSQCKELQAMNVDPHWAQIFCWDAEELGWAPESPAWEVRMEVRCQEGHWDDRTKGNVNDRKRRHTGMVNY